MNNDHHAIVVGIRDYPHFGTTQQEPRHLKGPDNDASAVYEWLVHPDKGGVPPANVALIRSRDFNPPGADPVSARPQKQAIIDAFDRLDALAHANDDAGKGLKVGSRLYIYMSGHGFAPKRKEGAVFLADATRQRTHHVFASRWMDWFYNAQYFDEFVLWMDCCMVFDISVVPEATGYRVLQGTGVGAAFSAFAAKFPLQAVEREMPDGKFHGVFTYTLLRGLEGAAVDPPTNKVTSDSLKRYLINYMKTLMIETDRNDTGVSQEPDFGADDPMVLCTVANVPRSKVVFSFPAAAEGKAFSVVTGAPPAQVAQGVVAQRRAEVKLPTGVYFVKAPPALAVGFEVAGEQEVHVNA